MSDDLTIRQLIQVVVDDLAEVKTDVKMLLGVHNQEVGRQSARASNGVWFRWLPTLVAALFTVTGVLFTIARG